MAAARPAHPQGLRVREAALHRLPALRRAARAAPRVPGDLPAGAARPAFRPPARRRRPRRPAARAGLRPGDPARKAGGALRPVRRGASPAVRSRCSGVARATAGSSPGRTPRPTSRRPPCWTPPTPWSLHHAEPFGPLDSVVFVDTEAELLAAMNATTAASSQIATDDPTFGARVAEQLQAFKVGVNKPRCRGDREELFGGIGRVVEGRVRRRRPARARGHGRHPGRRRAAVRKLPELLPLPRPLTNESEPGQGDYPGGSEFSAGVSRTGGGPAVWSQLICMILSAMESPSMAPSSDRGERNSRRCNVHVLRS